LNPAFVPPEFLESHEAKLVDVQIAVGRIEQAVDELSRTVATIDAQTKENHANLTTLWEFVGRLPNGMATGTGVQAILEMVDHIKRKIDAPSFLGFTGDVEDARPEGRTAQDR
jgi:hypothetical protein